MQVAISWCMSSGVIRRRVTNPERVPTFVAASAGFRRRSSVKKLCLPGWLAVPGPNLKSTFLVTTSSTVMATLGAPLQLFDIVSAVRPRASRSASELSDEGSLQQDKGPAPASVRPTFPHRQGRLSLRRTTSTPPTASRRRPVTSPVPPSANCHSMSGLRRPEPARRNGAGAAGRPSRGRPSHPIAVIAMACTRGVGHVSPRRSAAGAPRTARATTPPAGSTPIRRASVRPAVKSSRRFVEISGIAAAGVVSTGI